MGSLSLLPTIRASLISEEDAHYLLRTPFSYREKYHTYEEYHHATLAEVDAWAGKQAQALARASRSWDTCISMLKQACREFCARVEPEFEPFLQEVLFIAAKGWNPFPPWDHLFAFGDHYGCPKYISQRLHWWVEERVEILKHPKEWIESLLTTFYAVYQARPHRSEKGVFLREFSGEECVTYVGKVYEAISEKGLHLHGLPQRNYLLDKKGKYLAPDSELRLRNLEFLKNTPFYLTRLGRLVILQADRPYAYQAGINTFSISSQDLPSAKYRLHSSSRARNASR